jgi:hypothetical protein
MYMETQKLIVRVLDNWDSILVSCDEKGERYFMP